MTEEQKNLQLGEQLMRALEACDVEAVRALYHPEAQIWHNFDQRMQSVEQNLKSLERIHRKLRGLNYQIKRREPVPGGFYQQHLLCGTLSNGEAFALPACAIVKIEDGRIVALDEYLDAGQARALQD